MSSIIRPLQLLLASKSPRRRQLIEGLGYAYSLAHQDIEESYPPDLDPRQVPAYLAERKAEAVVEQLQAPNQVILASDTIVLLDGQIYPKPEDVADARRILQALAGRVHEVITGVCLCSTSHRLRFSDVARVHLAPMTAEEIDFYIERYQPFDKAGAYAIQEWIGLAKIEKIEGSHLTVMGLPTHLVYKHLQAWPLA